MPKIHPSAIVGERVQLADDVEVGPWCLLEGDITIGPGCVLEAGCRLKGPLIMGARNRCSTNVYLGCDPQDRSYPPDKPGAGVVIGDDNVFREGVSIHRATKDRPTTVGSGNYLMMFAHLAHDCVLGSRCTLANNTLLGGHVHVGDQVVTGGGAAFHQFSRIGRLAVVGGLVGGGRDVPPFCAVYYETHSIGSLNLVGLRRNGLREHIKPLKQAFDIAFKHGLANKTVADRVTQELGDDPLCREFAEFFRTTKRGIMWYRPARGGDDE